MGKTALTFKFIFILICMLFFNFIVSQLDFFIVAIINLCFYTFIFFYFIIFNMNYFMQYPAKTFFKPIAYAKHTVDTKSSQLHAINLQIIVNGLTDIISCAKIKFHLCLTPDQGINSVSFLTSNNG